MALIVGGTVLFILPVAMGAGSVLAAWGTGVAEASVRNSSLLLAQLARLIILTGMAATLLTLLIPVFGLAYLVTRTVGLQILRESVADAAYNRRGIVRYLRLWLPAALLLAGMELGFLITPIPMFSPAGQMIAALNWVFNAIWVLPWMAGGTGLIWLLFVYARYFGRRVLGAKAVLTPPKWADRVYSVVLTSLLGFLFIPLLLSRLIVVYPSEPSFQPLHSLVVWFSLSLLFLLVYVAGFALTWIVIMIRRVNLVQQCPLCGQISRHKEALRQTCEHCPTFPRSK
jgi:hypothetical protein